MSRLDDLYDFLFTMRAARDAAEAVCAGSNYTQQDWDDLQHFRAEVLRVERELAERRKAASANAPRGQRPAASTTTPALGRTVREGDYAMLARAYLDGCHRNGQSVPKSPALAMPGLGLVGVLGVLSTMMPRNAPTSAAPLLKKLLGPSR